MCGGGGGGYIRGVGIFFGGVLGGLKIKIPWGRGGSYISSGIWGGGGGSDVFHWFLHSLKVKASGGQAPQTPHIPNDTANNIKHSK